MNLDRFMRKYETFEKNFPSGKTSIFWDEVYYNEDDLKSYMEYFYKSNVFNFDQLMNKIDFNRYKRVVDVHGLFGNLSMMLKKKFPNVEFISFDNKKLQTHVETRLKGNDMWDLVKVEYGNLAKDNIPSDCDCVIAPHILMQFGCDNRKNIIKGFYNKLNNNGDLIIMENLLDENRSKDDCGLKISFMFAMMGYEGYSMTFEEYRKLLLDCGFMDVCRIPKSPGMSDIIIAKKITDANIQKNQ